MGARQLEPERGESSSKGSQSVEDNKESRFPDTVVSLFDMTLVTPMESKERTLFFFFLMEKGGSNAKSGSVNLSPHILLYQTFSMSRSLPCYLSLPPLPFPFNFFPADSTHGHPSLSLQ